VRPEILRPLFAEAEALKGIGPALARPLHKLGLDQVVDILFHLPVSWIDRNYVLAPDGGAQIPEREPVYPLLPWGGKSRPRPLRPSLRVHSS
jgi:ATP-dependent DNA helicase RecG